MLGTEEDLIALVREGERYGIRIMLDGVFSHTGADSVYFDQKAFMARGLRNPRLPLPAWYEFASIPGNIKACGASAPCRR